MVSEVRRAAGLHYEEHGDGDGPVLVLLHGFGCTANLWSGMIPLLDGYHVIAFDLPGHGRSADVVSGGQIPNLARSVHDALEELNLCSYHLVGYSMGGATSMRLALDHPEEVQSVFCIVPQTSAGNPPDDPVAAAFHGAYGDREALAQGVASISVHPHKTKGLVDDMLTVSKENWDGYLTDGVFRSQAEELPTAQMPVCYLVGGKDNVQVLERQLSDIRAIAGGRLVFLNEASHLCSYEMPESLAAELLFFVSSLEGGRDRAAAAV